MKNPRDQPRDNLLHTLSGSIMVLPIIIFSKFFPLKKSTDKSATEKIQLITVGLQNKNSSFLKNNVEPPNSRDIPKIILVFFETFFSIKYSKHTWIKRPIRSIKVAKNISRV